MTSFLLDTHILLWWRGGLGRLSKSQEQVLTAEEQHGRSVGVSAISLRELAMIGQRRKIRLDTPIDSWLEDMESHPLIKIFPLTSEIAVESVRLGDDFPRDPADQIIVATARCHGLTLITADERIRKWGKVNLV